MADNRKEKFETALSKVSVPVLVLDNRWHRLFKRIGITPEISALEKELGELLKRQGKINTEIKSLKKIKSDLMRGIVDNMDDGSGQNRQNEKTQEDNKRLINDANDKIAAHEDELMELPREIDRVNRQLMLLSMDLCYDKLSENTDEIEKIAEWIKDIRIELKKNVIRKQEMEVNNADLYTYMHNIFGPDVMEIFDMRYEPKIRVPELKPGSDKPNGEGTKEGSNSENK